MIYHCKPTGSYWPTQLYYIEKQKKIYKKAKATNKRYSKVIKIDDNDIKWKSLKYKNSLIYLE